MNTFKRSLAKLQAILLAGLMLMPVHVPVGAAAFVATTMLTATEAEARPGVRVCMNTRLRYYYYIKKGGGSCALPWKNYSRWTCEQTDDFFKWGRGHACRHAKGIYQKTLLSNIHLYQYTFPHPSSRRKSAGSRHIGRYFYVFPDEWRLSK